MMNLFETPELVSFEKNGLSLTRLNGLNWIEKDWYYREEARLRMLALMELQQCAKTISNEVDLSYDQVEDILRGSKLESLPMLREHDALIIDMQSKQALAQMETDYRLVGMMLSSRIDDNWLHTQLESIRTFYLNDLKSWSNLSLEDIWKKLNCKPNDRTSNQFRLESMTEFARKMPPPLFLALINFCDSEVNFGKNKGENVSKKTSPQEMSSSSSERKKSDSQSAA